MDPDDVSALRTLSDAPVPDDLPGAALDQLLEPGDIAFMDSSDYRHFDHRALELATVLDLLGADDAVRRAALDRILAHLAGIAEPDTTVSKVAEAIAVLRPAPEHRAGALALLFRRLAGSMEGWRRRLLLENISQLLPSPPDVGPVLLLLSDSGPWPGTGDTGALLARLCAGAPEEDQQAAAARHRAPHGKRRGPAGLEMGGTADGAGAVGPAAGSSRPRALAPAAAHAGQRVLGQPPHGHARAAARR